MSEYTPTTEAVRDRYSEGWPEESANFDTWLASVQAEAWEEGHRHRQRRGTDDCHCYAAYAGECACGKFGTGDLLSLKDNPYKNGDKS